MSGTPYNTRNNEFFGDMAAWIETHAADNENDLMRLKRGLRAAREEELTKRQRQMLHMRFEQEKSISQIADELGVDKSTVSRTLTRARRRLYKCLRYAL